MYEIRWFFKGKISKKVKGGWFESLPRPKKISPDEGPRKEVYLRCKEDIGLKISRGGLEYKFRDQPGELLALDQGRAGFLEYWEKESWKYNQSPKGKKDPVFSSFKAAGLKGDRFVTKKERVQRKFELKNVGFDPVDRNDKVEKGLVVELADLKVNDSLQLWTLLFELISKEKSEEDKKILKKGIEWLLDQNWPTGVSLKWEDSMGYPGLFEQLVPAT